MIPALLDNINNNDVTDPDLDLLFDALWPIPSSPSAPGRYRRTATSNLPSASLKLYNKVRRKYLNRDGTSIKLSKTSWLQKEYPTEPMLANDR